MSCKKMEGQRGGQKCSDDEGIKRFHTYSLFVARKCKANVVPRNVVIMGV